MNPKRARARCLSPVELERAYWSDDADVRAHAGGCDRCGREWAEIAALVDMGRAIPPPAPSLERREEIRTALLSKEWKRERTPDRTRWLVMGSVAAAAALAIAWWTWPGGGEAVERARLLAHGDARYLRASPAPDEIVRLVDGTVTVEVDRLQRGERFRIVTGDAEVEVRGTAFDVTASGDRLRSVRVIHGSVEVRRAGAAIRILSGGEAWEASDVAAGAPGAVGRGASAAGVTAGPSAASVAADATAAGDRGSAQRPGSREGTARERPRGAAMQDRVDRGPMTATRAAAQQAYDEAWAALRSGSFDRAAAAFERAAARDRTGAIAEDARYWRAVALARGGNSPAAATAFESFLADHPSSPRAGEASVILGWLRFDDGDYDAAARRFRAGATDPSDRVRASAAKGLTAIRRAQQ